MALRASATVYGSASVPACSMFTIVYVALATELTSSPFTAMAFSVVVSEMLMAPVYAVLAAVGSVPSVV